jgi:hypothetical protein
VVLPNFTAYTFTYDGYATSAAASQAGAYGDLLQITLPTGGTISYQWTDAPISIVRPSSNINDIRILKSRTVDANDGTGPHKWIYTIAPGPGYNQFLNDYPYLSITTDPLGNDTVHCFTDIDPTDVAQMYYETSTKYYQGLYTATSPNLLKTVTTQYKYSSWQQYFHVNGNIGFRHAINVVPGFVSTTYPDGSGLTKRLNYDPGYQLADMDGNLTGVYGIVGNMISETDVDAKTNSVIRVVTNMYKTDAADIQAGLLHLLSDTKITDGLGNFASETTYSYDSAGNRTSTSSVVGNGTQITSSVTYDGNGMPASTIDALMHTTTITRDGTGLYVDHITKPTTANGVPHIEYYSYDLNSANLLLQTDENDNTTMYDYHDPMGRLKQITYPSTQYGQGQVSLNYDDMLHTVTATTLATPDPTITMSKAFDGLGRLSQATGGDG